MAINLIAFLWGLAEATFFFIVPDVYLSYLALRNTRQAFIACFYSLAGAILGGCIMYYLGLHYFEQVIAWLDYIPAISPQLIDEIGYDFTRQPLEAMIEGSLTGKPYKVFAVWASHTQMGLLLFWLLSFIARLLRFAGVTAITAGLRNLAKDSVSPRLLLLYHGTFWCFLYTVYFMLF